MDGHDLLAERFGAHRTHLRAVAYRMLGRVCLDMLQPGRRTSPAGRQRAAYRAPSKSPYSFMASSRVMKGSELV